MNPPDTLLLFGGTFNPPHRAHFLILHAAIDALRPTRCELIPSGQPWQKPEVAPIRDRLAMLELALADDYARHLLVPSSCPIVINPIEANHAGASYTIDTLLSLRTAHPDTHLLWLMGSDQLLNFHTWKNWHDILNHAHLVVAQRAGVIFDDTAWHNDEWHDYYRQHHCLASDKRWRAQQNGCIITFDAPQIEVSSTQIRHAIAHHLPTPALCSSVLTYIRQHHLYVKID